MTHYQDQALEHGLHTRMLHSVLEQSNVLYERMGSNSFLPRSVVPTNRLPTNVQAEHDATMDRADLHARYQRIEGFQRQLEDKYGPYYGPILVRYFNQVHQHQAALNGLTDEIEEDVHHHAINLFEAELQSKHGPYYGPLARVYFGHYYRNEALEHGFSEEMQRDIDEYVLNTFEQELRQHYSNIYGPYYGERACQFFRQMYRETALQSGISNGIVQGINSFMRSVVPSPLAGGNS